MKQYIFTLIEFILSFGILVKWVVYPETITDIVVLFAGLCGIALIEKFRFS